MPKTCATIPEVAGMVANHKKPKHIPNPIARKFEPGKNKNNSSY